jgi:soluble lytic murein transglycosylase-like protein
MSATITLNAPVARNINATSSLVQLGLMIAGLLLALVFFNTFAGKTLVNQILTAELSAPDEISDADFLAEPDADVEVLTPRMYNALDYVTRRYRVSQKALLPIFEAAQLTGRERGLDPLLIVAIIGIESGFNPLAESSMGAQGLMQIIPRFHQEKLPEGAGDSSLLDPVINVQVGVQVLQEAIRRRGGLIAGLQQYAGSSDSEGAYANKVLAEKRRLEQVGRRTVVAGL